MDTRLLTPVEKRKIEREKRICSLWFKYRSRYAEVSTNRITLLIQSDLSNTGDVLCYSSIRSILVKNGLIEVTPRT